MLTQKGEENNPTIVHEAMCILCNYVYITCLCIYLNHITTIYV